MLSYLSTLAYQHSPKSKQMDGINKRSISIFFFRLAAIEYIHQKIIFECLVGDWKTHHLDSENSKIKCWRYLWEWEWIYDKFDKQNVYHESFFYFFFPVFFRYILSPFGRTLGIKSTRSKRATPNPILEAAYNKCSRIHHKTVSNIFVVTTCTTAQKTIIAVLFKTKNEYNSIVNVNSFKQMQSLYFFFLFYVDTKQKAITLF